MKKKNRGFTLIELIVAIAVLSVMAAVLLQTFVVSRRMALNARRDEVEQDAGRKTMEALKGYSFETLDRLAAKTGGGTGTVTIAGTEYRYEPLSGSGNSGDAGDGAGNAAEGTGNAGEDAGNAAESGGEGYLLTCYYKINETDAKAAYLVEAEADFGKYGGTETSGTSGAGTDTVDGINHYRMPNIADVSSVQNVVLEPELFTREDALRTEELLLKVNPEPETDENGDAADGGDSSGGEEPEYDAGDVRRYLQLSVKESGSGEEKDVAVSARVAYTVDSSVSGWNDLDSDLTVVTAVLSVKKRAVRNEDGNPANRIYLFLPAEREFEFERIFVTADIPGAVKELKPDPYEMYVIAADGKKAEIDKPGTSQLELYTNFDGDIPVSFERAKKRLYRLRVTVYEADYSGGGAEPVKGKALLTLDSSKRE